jgi:hypothetical protein
MFTGASSQSDGKPPSPGLPPVARVTAIREPMAGRRSPASGEAKQERGDRVDARGDQRDDQVVADVLSELRALRLRLSSDLSAASGAVDSGEPEVASDILDGDRDDLRRFLDQARQRLDDGAVEPPDVAGGGTTVPLPRSRWRRVLPAIPAVGVLAASAAAAAILAPRLGDHRAEPASPGRATAANAVTAAAPASFRQLRAAIIGHAPASQVLAAAHRWHRHVAVLIASSSADPRQLGTLIALLRQETSLLRQHQVPEAEAVLAAAHRLETHLLQTAEPLLSGLPMPTASLLVPLPALPAPTTHRHRGKQGTHSLSPSSARTSASPSSSTGHRTRRPSTSASPSPSSTRWTPPWQPTSSGPSLWNGLTAGDDGHSIGGN